MEGRHTRQVVTTYSATNRLELNAPSGRYVVTPQQEPWLRVHSDTCVALTADTALDATCGDVEGRLDEATIRGERLHLPRHAPLRLASIDDLQLVMLGEPASARNDAAEPTGDRPTTQVKPKAPRQLWGVQLGGSSYVQVSFRWAFVRFLHLELGALALGPEAFANGSAGSVAELPFENGWAPYVGAGAGAAWGAGPGEAEECGKPSAECPTSSSSESLTFWYGRVGLAKYLQWEHRHRVGIDAGFWRGIRRTDQPERREPFFWPMAGLSYHLVL